MVTLGVLKVATCLYDLSDNNSNNLALLMDLHLSMPFAIEKTVKNLQIYKDSLLIIKWMNKKYVRRNYILQYILNEVFIII